MKKLVLSLVVSSALIGGLVPSAAQAGEVRGAGAKVGNTAVAADKATPLKPGDEVVAGENGAVIKSAAGDEIRLDKGAVVMLDSVNDGVELYVVKSGSAVGSLSTKTSLGSPAGWATAPEGLKTQVRVETAGGEGRFRTVSGGTWIRTGSENDTKVWLGAEQGINLWRDAKKSSLCFRSSQQNKVPVELTKTVSGGDIVVTIPRAATGCVEAVAGNKTKISNDVNSNKQEKLGVSTTFGSASTVAIGPGGIAVVDNQRGTIEVTEDIVDDRIGEELPSFDAIDNAADASLTTKKKR